MTKAIAATKSVKKRVATAKVAVAEAKATKATKAKAAAQPDPYNAPATRVASGIEGMLQWAATLNILTSTGASPYTEVK